jgi:hypothetical protein
LLLILILLLLHVGDYTIKYLQFEKSNKPVFDSAQ